MYHRVIFSKSHIWMGNPSLYIQATLHIISTVLIGKMISLFSLMYFAWYDIQNHEINNEKINESSGK